MANGAQNEDIEAVVSALARQGLTDQQQLVSDMRAGAGMLLAAGSLIASFLGSAALDHGGFTGLAWLAILALVTSLLATLYVLIPRLALEFVVRTADLRRAVPTPVDGRAVHSSLTRLSNALQARNARIVRRVFQAYLVAVVAVVAQVALWMSHLLATM